MRTLHLLMFSDKNLPNILTCLNLLCGCLAIVSVFSGNVTLLVGMVFLAAMFDFLDGITARSLNANSDLGRELDSLADMVTFGVVPGMILYDMMVKGQAQEIIENEFLLTILKYFPFIVTVFAAYRLAKFNTERRQSETFLGLPTPAVGMLVTSFPLILRQDIWHLASIINHPFFIIITSILLSVLMISEIPMFAFKFKNRNWKDNKTQYIYLITSFILLIILQSTAVPLLFVLYITFSLVNNSMMQRTAS